MMTNIRGLSLFFFVSIITAHDIELRIPDVSDENLAYIKRLGNQYPGKTMKIEVLPEATFFEKIKRNIIGDGNADSAGQGGGFSTKAALTYFIKSCFGVTAVSYFSIAYVIFRVYKIAKKISLWFKEDEQEEDSMDDIERMLFKKKKFTLSRSDKRWLKLYISLNQFLKEKGIRRYFKTNKELDKLIYSYYRL